MKTAIRLTSLLIVSISFAAPALASDAEEIESMLHEFLAASNTEAAHEVFWADDLVYTSSDGTRFDKAFIMNGFEDAEPSSGPPATVYSGEDVDIRIYGDMAVVAFKLVGTPTDKSDGASVLYYFNTGTFLKRDGVWRVVAWQATKIPPGD